MRAKFTDNLGSRDADKHALDFRACGRGMECEVSEEVGLQIIRRGFATEVPAAETKAPVIQDIEMPAVIQAIPDKPSIGEPESPQIKTETIPARGAARKTHFSRKDDL